MEAWELLYMFKKQNQVADLMAKEGLKYNHYDYTRIFIHPPSLVQEILLANEMGTSYVRGKTIPNISYSG